MRKRSPNLDRLSLELYGAVLDGQSMEPTLGRIAHAIGADRLIAQRASMSSPDSSTRLVAALNVDPEALSSYADHWVAHDPWMKAARGYPAGVYNMQSLIPKEELHRTAFWNEFLSRHSPTRFGLCSLMAQPGTMTGIVSVWRDDRNGSFTDNAESLFQAIAPHIDRAFVAATRLNDGSRASTAFDVLPLGIAIIDASGRIGRINAALQVMVGRSDGLALSRSGLVAANATAQRSLDVAIGNALLASSGAARFVVSGSVVTLPRPSGATPWRAEILPIAPGRDGPFSSHTGALVLITDPTTHKPPSEAALVQAFGLTPAEASLAIGLMAGATIAAYAKRRNIAVATARTHLSRVLEKTNCRRQQELIAKLSML